jgi:uncharacterized membrane protein
MNNGAAPADLQLMKKCLRILFVISIGLAIFIVAVFLTLTVIRKFIN